MAQTRKTLFRRLSTLFLIVFATIASIQIGLLLWLFLRVADESEQSLMSGAAKEIAEQLQPYAGDPPDSRELTSLTRYFTISNPRLVIYLISNEGMIQAQFGKQGPSPKRQVLSVTLLEDLLRKHSLHALPIYGPDPESPDRQVICAITRMNVLGKPGYLYLVLNSRLAAEAYGMKAENVLAVSALLFFFGSSLFAAFLGWLLLRYLRKRVDRVVSVVERLAENDLRLRVKETSNDEIGVLGRSIDRMADRLEDGISLLAERDALRRQLIADVSHDLRGPVASLKGYLEVLTMMSEQRLIERIPEMLPALSVSAGSLERLLVELFELAKIEAREREPERLAFSLSELLDEVIQSCGGQALMKKVFVQCDRNDEPYVVRGDPSMLFRALQNLLINAISYSPTGGKVLLRLERLDDVIEVSFEDEGKGVAPGDVERIFKRFETGTQAAEREEPSSGLGLAIVQHILRIHGADIKLRNGASSGAIFSFRLPSVETTESLSGGIQ